MNEMRAGDATPAPDDGNMPALEDPAPAAEAPVADEVTDAPETTEEAPDKPKPADRRVPLAALHEEREKRKSLEKQLRDEVVGKTRTEERLAMLAATVQEALKPPPAAAAAPIAIPDFDADPAGHIRATFTAQQRQMEELRGALGQYGQNFQQMQQAAAQQQQVADLQRWAQQQEAAEIAANPAYIKAQEHLLAGRHAELEAIGYSPEQRQQAIYNDILQLANSTRQNGGNFAQAVVAIAKSRGWAPPAAPPPETGIPIADASEAATRAATQQRGQDMALSLGSRGGAPRGPVTAASLAAMSDADFSKLLAAGKKDPALMQQWFGS